MRLPVNYRLVGIDFAKLTISAAFTTSLVLLVVSAIPWPDHVFRGDAVKAFGIGIICAGLAWLCGFCAMRVLDLSVDDETKLKDRFMRAEDWPALEARWRRSMKLVDYFTVSGLSCVVFSFISNLIGILSL